MKNYMMINGTKIEISQETADNLEQKFGEKTYSIGDRFVRGGDGIFAGYKYILVRASKDGVLLAALKDGCRWTSPIDVPTPTKITQKAFGSITTHDDFTRYWDARKQEKC